MPLFRGSVDSLSALIERQELVTVLAERFRHRYQQWPSDAETRSWARSLAVLSDDLRDADLGSLEILVEYQLPLTSKRVDALLCGRDPRTGADTYLVVELKQWTTARMAAESSDLCILDAPGERLHPVYQVRGYIDYMSDFLATLAADDTRVRGVAYLHNARDSDVQTLWDHLGTDDISMFTGDRRAEWLAYLTASVAPDHGSAADRLLGSAVKPSKKLLTVAADEVQRQEQYVLLDQQRVAYSLVMRAVRNTLARNSKEVIIVSGGPGSGKSVIALALLGELARQGRTAIHATGSSAFTETLRRVAGARNPRVQKLFAFFNSFVDIEPNSLDVLIADEAHRIRQTSANRFTPARNRTGRRQIDELIDAARVPVFLLDEHQVVRPGELGTVHDIIAAADRRGLTHRVIDLNDQFRLGGSRAYETWVLRLLGLEDGGPARWQPDGRFELRVAESPSGLESALRQRMAEGDVGRIAAGYAWRWSEPVSDGTLMADVVIGEWKKPWNNKKKTRHGDAPGTPFWASDPNGFEQVGCVYTAQGFEYDYAGVIFADDLVWREDRWVARPEFSHDAQAKRGSSEEFAQAVLNTYKVLLTRGLKGATLFSTDPETQEFLRGLV